MKLKWCDPELTRLSGKSATVRGGVIDGCTNGSGESFFCSDGATADTDCSTGSVH